MKNAILVKIPTPLGGRSLPQLFKQSVTLLNVLNSAVILSH